MTISLANILAYSVQLAVLVAAAVGVTWLVRLRSPLPSLRFWQSIVVLAVVLPFVQPAKPTGDSRFLLASLIVEPSALPTASCPADSFTWPAPPPPPPATYCNPPST